MRKLLTIILLTISVSLFAQRRKGLASGTTSNHQVATHKDAFKQKTRREQNVYIGHLPFMYHFSKKKRYEYRYSRKSADKRDKRFAHKRRYKARVRQSGKGKSNKKNAQTTGGARRKPK